MKRNLVRGLGVVGALVTIQSVLWEVARMKPDYGFLVTPWSIRGYETVHGAIYAAIGVVMLGAVLLTMWSRSQEPRLGIAIAGYMVVAATVVTAVFASEPKIDAATGLQVVDAQGEVVKETTRIDVPSGLLVLVLAVFIAMLAYIGLRGYVVSNTPVLQRRGVLPAATAASFVIAFLVASALIGSEVRLMAWFAVFLVTALLAVMSSLFRPRELAANRMLIAASVVAGSAIGTSAGAIRGTLLRFQVTEIGTAAQYKDSQVTWGYFLASIGMALAFVGAVAIWAQRRDSILNMQRARRQREAAEQSAAEVESALQIAP
ncbi:MAG: hypothetical protein ACE5GC_09745 [Acidimicrobiia bacterium]